MPKASDLPQSQFANLDFLGAPENAEDSKSVSLGNLSPDVFNFFKKTYPGRSGAAKCAFVDKAIRAYIDSQGFYIAPDGSVCPKPVPA